MSLEVVLTGSTSFSLRTLMRLTPSVSRIHSCRALNSPSSVMMIFFLLSVCGRCMYTYKCRELKKLSSNVMAIWSHFIMHSYQLALPISHNPPSEACLHCHMGWQVIVCTEVNLYCWKGKNTLLICSMPCRVMSVSMLDSMQRRKTSSSILSTTSSSWTQDPTFRIQYIEKRPAMCAHQKVQITSWNLFSSLFMMRIRNTSFSALSSLKMQFRSSPNPRWRKRIKVDGLWGGT